jgi:hypothetical protein|tara:strand:+ start:2867 stop:3259 length:393 start_codon:yes stop_codon:yes gene_type:complete
MKTMRDIRYILLILTVSLGTIHAGCGSCNISKKKAERPIGEFVTDINDDGKVKGLVLASCGMCNFGMRNRKCSLAIQINETAFNVKGSKIDDHGDSHANDGFCNAVRVAKVSGKIDKSTFIADSFELQKN